MEVIRLIEDSDSREEITNMLHRAYRRHAERGLHFLASHQSVEKTVERINGGLTFLMMVDSNLVGIVTLKLRKEGNYGNYKVTGPAASFTQFAVEPTLQGHGYGKRLLRHIEQVAKENECEEIMLDTSQLATDLIGFYQINGYEIRATADWRPVVNYESYILVKNLLT
jgi:GNAT superfamily N-acetyltransferase